MAALGELGFESFEETDRGVNAYIPKAAFEPDALAALPYWESGAWEAAYTLEEIPRQNWNAVWESEYKPIRINDQITVRAPFHPPARPEVPYELVIAPKMSFGTGHHETTWLMLRMLLEEAVEGCGVLDMGCGTGVLAILAARRGAKRVLAIDIDPWSVENTRENAEANGHPEIAVREGDASLLGQERFDLVLANINKNILLEDLKAYAAVLVPGGGILLSGFYQADLPDVEQAAAAEGLSLTGSQTRNGWVAAAFRKRRKTGGE